MAQLQRWFVDREALFERCLVPACRLHTSLLLTRLAGGQEVLAREACEAAGEEIRKLMGCQPLRVIGSGVGSFNGKVLFSRIRTEPRETLQNIHSALVKEFGRRGLPVLDEGSGLGSAFTAHASFLKVTKGIAHAQGPQEKAALQRLFITDEDLLPWQNVFFGAQLCSQFELLAMEGLGRDGYYPSLCTEAFSSAAGGGPGPVGRVWAGTLRVEPSAGAGLELAACEAGYLVEGLDDWPGQPELSRGDAIVGIGGRVLLGLPEEEVETRFGEAFCDGVPFAAGVYEDLLRRPFEEVKRDVEQLVGAAPRPTRRLSSLVSCQLRPDAPPFRPDPWLQSCVDPWAAHPRPRAAGWSLAAPVGARVDARGAGCGGVEAEAGRRLVDSRRFLQAGPQPLQLHEALAAPIHDSNRALLAGAFSAEGVLHVADRERLSFNFCNRVSALERLANLTAEPGSLRVDARLQRLLADLREDLEDAAAVRLRLPPARLASLASALGQLRLGGPELCQALVAAVLARGVWNFSDEEAAELLTGASHLPLSNELLFQEAARLAVGRLGSFAPRALAAVTAALARAGIVIEHFFLAVGDEVAHRPSAFSTCALAELAEAFNRAGLWHAALLGEVLPAAVGPALGNRGICSEADLERLFSAYCSSRAHEAGGATALALRDALACEVLRREASLSVVQARRVLQACALAGWAHRPLLQAAARAAARAGDLREAAMVCDCFRHLGADLPADFPYRPPGGLGPRGAENTAAALKGRRVALHVLFGRWEGRHVADVLDADSAGVRLRHEEDGFLETLPWSFLGGPKYLMEPLADTAGECAGEEAPD